jgi:hypothetical protein
MKSEARRKNKKPEVRSNNQGARSKKARRKMRSCHSERIEESAFLPAHGPKADGSLSMTVLSVASEGRAV